MKLEEVSDHGCWLLYIANKDPLPENPCIKCCHARRTDNAGTEPRCVTISRCSEFDDYLAKLKPYIDSGVADVAGMLSAYRRNSNKKAELSEKLQKIEYENAGILQELPDAVSEALAANELPECLLTGQGVDALLACAIRAPIPNNPCDGCPEKFSMLCYDCARDKRYNDVIKPYMDAGIFETAKQISIYFNNVKESEKLCSSIARISLDNEAVLGKLPNGIEKTLKQGRQLETERVQQEKKKNEIQKSVENAALEEQEVRSLTVLVSRYFTACDNIRGLEEYKKQLLNQMPEELADKVLAKERTRNAASISAF